MSVSRTVLSFELVGTQVTLKLDRATGPVADLGINTNIDLATLAQGSLQQQGEAMMKLLCESQAVSDGLALLRGRPLGSEPAPVYFRMRTELADVVAWEQIYDQATNGFFALDQRRPMGRIANEAGELAPRVFAPPLRLVAVLSAAGRDALPQLEVLLDAVSAGAALPILLHVISGSATVRDRATAAGATAELIAPTAPSLAQQITDSRPHLLHVLCHGGSNAAGLRTLAFANAADFDRAQIAPDAGDTGSVRMALPDFISALLPANPWLVVLASCQSAQAGAAGQGREGLAAAHEMVSSGLPAVIGMRRLVDLTDTDVFCQALYPEVIKLVQLAARPGPGGQPGIRQLDWAQVMTAPRVVMAAGTPDQVDSWTDPVLYAQEDPLLVFLAPSPAQGDRFAELRGRLDQLTGVLATQDPATANPGMIQELRERIAQAQADLAGLAGAPLLVVPPVVAGPQG